MIIKLDYVTNSSTVAFTIVGKWFDIRSLMKDQKLFQTIYLIHIAAYKESYGFCSMEKFVSREVYFGLYNDEDYVGDYPFAHTLKFCDDLTGFKSYKAMESEGIYLGLEAKDIGDNETGLEFKKRSFKLLKHFGLAENLNEISYITESYRDD